MVVKRNYVPEKGDIKICVDSRGKKEIYIPYRNRFSHTLILGPTGCCKTTRILAPMIEQDLKNLNAGIIVMEPKCYLSEIVLEKAKKHEREIIYLNPASEETAYFNPLIGDEDEVISNMIDTYQLLNIDSSQYFIDVNKVLIINALKVVKRLKGDNATLIDVEKLVANNYGEGRKMIMGFSKLAVEDESIARENQLIANYFLTDYFSEKSKTYENCHSFRVFISNILSNEHARKFLNPEDSSKSISLKDKLNDNTVLIFTGNLGALRNAGNFIQLIFMITLQNAIFNKNKEANPQFLYLDEAQCYMNTGFLDVIRVARSYGVSINLASQNKTLLGMGFGKKSSEFVEMLTANIRNFILNPCLNLEDINYFSELFNHVSGNNDFNPHSLINMEFLEVAYLIYNKDDKLEVNYGRLG